MNFSGNNNIQGTLPQFSELTSRSNSTPNVEFSHNSNNSDALPLQTVQSSIYNTAAGSNQNKQQFLVNSQNKYPGSLFTWPDSNTLMQLCEKQDTHKEENKTDNEMRNSDEQQAVQLVQGSNMAEYIQKLQATTLPLTLQQLIKLQSEQMKKEKMEEEKLEHTQNNILNIPSVSVFRNPQTQNGNNFMNSEHMMITLNPNDFNVHLESNQQDNESNVQVVKVEQQVQTDSPKVEKKMKFRAKTGEIKISVALDGSRVYCCPECNLVFPEKSEIDQHIQAHIQERKYQCKECGAMLKRKEHLDQHMRGHSDERPYKCPVCEKAFKRNEHLTRHYVIHSGDKNFTCTVCQKAFSRKDHLNKHTQTHLGIKKSKGKKDVFFIEQKELFDKAVEVLTMPKQQEKDQVLLHTFSSFKEQSLKEVTILQQPLVNMNEILPQNTRYLMPS
ncbi:hypothetical protein HZH68_009405 [Vespula germanica]|uniref:C2H2-type domain-containing protein n=1 Tax=Vespula germanica TaxID=30212 RepID=A0A834N3G3_VESGE|nr:hypothetical protein HZH68_009405 [Vespula germanica]